MSSAAIDPQNNGGEPEGGPEKAAQTPQPALSRLLEHVMRQTLECCETVEPLNAAEMRALGEVARRYRGRPLVLEPVAVELVEAVLDSFCPTANNSSRFWRNISVQVAQSIIDDPPALARLKTFWIRLSEKESCPPSSETRSS